MIAAAAALAAACGSGGGFVDAPKPEPPAPPGSFSVDWTITKSGSASTCAAVGATSVVVTFQDEKTMQSASSTFSCALGGAISGAVTPATYDMGFALVGSAGSAPLAMGPPQTGVVIGSAQTAHLTSIVFAVP